MATCSVGAELNSFRNRRNTRRSSHRKSLCLARCVSVPNDGIRNFADQCRSNHHATGSDSNFRRATLMGQFINAANAQTNKISSVS
jgi:hypothetical protein